MKKSTSFFLLTLFLILSSCQKNEVIYSCIPAVDKRTKINLSEIRQMSRSNWMEIDEQWSIAVYRAFSPIQMQNFWLEKINEVLVLGWDSKEEAHLKKMIKYIIDNPKLFEINKDEDLHDDFEKFAYVWIEYAHDELYWTKKLIGAIIADGRKLSNKQGDVIIKRGISEQLVKSKSERGDEDNGLKCTCSVDYDWCSNGEACLNRGCDESEISWGCGTLWAHRCTGRCHPYEN